MIPQEQKTKTLQRFMEKVRALRTEANQFFGLKVCGKCAGCSGGNCSSCQGNPSVSLWDASVKDDKKELVEKQIESEKKEPRENNRDNTSVAIPNMLAVTVRQSNVAQQLILDEKRVELQDKIDSSTREEIGVLQTKQNQSDRIDPTASRWGMPPIVRRNEQWTTNSREFVGHSVTTPNFHYGENGRIFGTPKIASQIVDAASIDSRAEKCCQDLTRTSRQSSGVSDPQFANEPNYAPKHETGLSRREVDDRQNINKIDTRPPVQDNKKQVITSKTTTVLPNPVASVEQDNKIELATASIKRKMHAVLEKSTVKAADQTAIEQTVDVSGNTNTIEVTTRQIGVSKEETETPLVMGGIKTIECSRSEEIKKLPKVAEISALIAIDKSSTQNPKESPGTKTRAVSDRYIHTKKQVIKKDTQKIVIEKDTEEKDPVESVHKKSWLISTILTRKKETPTQKKNNALIKEEDSTDEKKKYKKLKNKVPAKKEKLYKKMSHGLINILDKGRKVKTKKKEAPRKEKAVKEEKKFMEKKTPKRVKTRLTKDKIRLEKQRESIREKRTMKLEKIRIKKQQLNQQGDVQPKIILQARKPKMSNSLHSLIEARKKRRMAQLVTRLLLERESRKSKKKRIKIAR